MKIIVLANGDQETEILFKDTSKKAEVIFVDNFPELLNQKYAEAYFILKDIEISELNNFTSRPVFFNSVISTLKELKLSKNISRINGWPTFLRRDNWEIANSNEQQVKVIFDALQWKYISTKDEPGLIAARIVSMIINEAFYALGEEISTKEEIDVAMKLGTNYPYGPFEWSQKIGLKNIYKLLKKLSENDGRCHVAPQLEKQITDQDQ